MYEKSTADILIKVNPIYLDDQSEPEQGRFVWAYHVTISNRSQDTVKLRSRYWRITDAYGTVQEVAGEGVVGEQPILAPGQSYEYTSGTPLPTPSGFMLGTYTMEKTTNGETFTVEIPAFSLDSPHLKAAVH